MSPHFLKLLLIEDDEDHTAIIRRLLRKSDEIKIDITFKANLTDGLEELSQNHYDILLLDLSLPDSPINKTLEAVTEKFPQVPIVILSSLADREMAVRLVHEGAQDYLCKADLNTDILIRTIRYGIERKDNQVKVLLESKRANALADISRMALKNSQMSLLFELILKNTNDILSTKFGEIVYVEEDDYIYKGGNTFGPSDIDNVIASKGDGSITDLCLSCQLVRVTENEIRPIVVNNFSAIKNIDKKEVVSLYENVNCAISYPLMIDGNNLSAVITFYSVVPKMFLDEELNFVESIGNILTSYIVRSNLEMELKDKIAELNNAHRRKDEFLATLSHELRTPLNVIVGYAELLEELDVSSTEFKNGLEAIKKNAYIEAQLISDTLDISKITTGKFKLENNHFKVINLVDSVVDSMNITAKNKGIKLYTSYELERFNSYWGDKDRIRQVLWNLLSNALKFTPSGGEVSITVKENLNDLLITVEDTGKGISLDNINHIFEKFWQEESALKKTLSGMGLGLSIAKQIIELHGGQIFASSKGENKGSVFTVILPVRKNQVPSKKIVQNMKNILTNESAQIEVSMLRAKKILLIDDDTDCCLLMEAFFKKYGASIDVIQNPIDALEKAKNVHYDCIISDLSMPILDGISLMDQYRQWESNHTQKHIPAIALTAFNKEIYMNEAMNAGFDKLYEKPFNSNQFLDDLKQLLN